MHTITQNECIHTSEYLVWKAKQPEVFMDMQEDQWLKTKGKKPKIATLLDLPE